MGPGRVHERLVLIVDAAALDGLPAILAAIPRGAALVQLRDKALPGRALHAAAAHARELTRAAGARLLINDRADVALAVGADGVHLPEDALPVPAARELLGPDALIGASAHSVAGAVARAADLVTLGPVWETPSKLAYGPPLGPAVLGDAARALPPTTRLYAVGGVDSPARASEAARAGAHGVAVIRAAGQAAALLSALEGA